MAAWCVLAAGCTTVVRNDGLPRGAAGSAPTDQTFAAAVAEATQSPWHGPTGEDEEATAARYVASLAGNADPEKLVLADAERQIDAALGLIAATETLAVTRAPSPEDVSALEGAISELRLARRVYIAALRDLDCPHDPHPRAVRRDFDAAIKALGDAADGLAEASMRDRLHSWTGPHQAPAEATLARLTGR